MSFTKIQRIKTLTWAASADSAGQLDLSTIPKSEAGRNVYVDALNIRVYGTLTNGAGTTQTATSGGVAKLIARVLLQIPNVGQLVNVRGIDLARIHRLRNAGSIAPGTGNVSIAGSGTGAVDFTLPVSFTDAYSMRPRDYSIPAALLSDANFLVTFGAGSDVNSNYTFAGTVEVSAICYERAELVVPTMTSVEALDFGAGTTEPSISKGAFKVSHMGIARQNGAAFATTEWTTVGLRYGAQQVSDDSQSVTPFYSLANATASTAFTDHTASTPTADDAVPVLVPNYKDRRGDKQTDLPSGAETCRLYTGTATNGYSVVRRTIWLDGPWRAQAERLIGIPPGSSVKPVTADGHDTDRASVANSLPKKLA